MPKVTASASALVEVEIEPARGRFRLPLVLRAGLAAPFELADKTGGGDYGVVNDAGVLWRPASEPLVLAIMTRTDRADAPYNNEVLAEVTRLIAAS